MPSPSELPPVTIGTAGHIDHGKTLLVEQLTGMRADRPQERERGMTIDIGYAEMRAEDGQRIGFVDLPGHERFIRNMVAGATGIDLALLVVAADDGVMPQTREHLDILGLLGVCKGVAVLNKIDLVDEELRGLAMEELQDYLVGSTLDGAPVLACSAATGEGVPELRNTLLGLVSGVATAPHPGAFFMAIQRRFAAAGFGCIVTGVPGAGSIRSGDAVEILPAGKKVRVRAIEVYHEKTENARAGHRTALNLAGAHHEEVARGMVVAAPGVYRPSRHLAASLALLPGARRPLRHGVELRVLSGTAEEMATLFLTRGPELAPGQQALVELRCSNPVTVFDGAPYIVRTSNARETVGGGRIIAALETPLRRKDIQRQQQLRAWETALPDPARRLLTALELGGELQPGPLAVRCQLDREASGLLVERLLQEGKLAQLQGGALVAADTIEQAVAALPGVLTALHAQQPLAQMLPIAAARDAAGISEALFMTALGRLGAQVVVDGRAVQLATHEVRIGEDTAEAARRVQDCLRDARFAPPARSKVAEATGLDDGEVEAAFVLLTDRGEVREVAPGLLFLKETLDEGVRLLQAVAQKRGSFEPVEAKAAFGGISRKWLIPLLEYYDRLGATRRGGNSRNLTKRGEAMARGGIDAT